MGSMYVVFVVAILVLIVLAKTAVVVPQQSGYVVETLGRYNRTIQAGFHILVPFIDRIAYKHNLKEEAMDIPEQVCITRDNVQVGVDGVLYLQVLDASKASYGITNYRFAIIQLAQTTLRSEIGKIELDRTFEERADDQRECRRRARQGVGALGCQGAALRNQEHQSARRTSWRPMEKQMRAEREKRAVVLTSEGERDAKINQAEGEKQRVIKESEGNKHEQINEAQGRRRRSSRSRPRRPKVSSRSARHLPGAAASRQCSCESPRSTSSSSARWRTRPRARSSSRQTCRTSPR